MARELRQDHFDVFALQLKCHLSELMPELPFYYLSI